jgi:hypothetical protein
MKRFVSATDRNRRAGSSIAPRQPKRGRSVISSAGTVNPGAAPAPRRSVSGGSSCRSDCRP